MKAGIKKKIAAGLCAALVLGSVGGAGYALAAADSGEKPGTIESGTEKSTALPIVEEETEVSKNETVYVLAGADGAVQKIIVSDWIKNAIGEAALTDTSYLSDIELVKGNESYTISGDHMRVWDAQGGDIYYQGNIEKELPVGISVTYRLDGKAIAPEELAGRSGKVTIRFDYTNNQYEYVQIDGRQEKIYVPFVMLTGILLDNDTFTNVEVYNGKLINDGSRTVIAGIAFPGLQEDLGIDSDKIEFPDYVEITADAKNFELGMTVTMTTNELFNRLDTDNMDSLDDLKDSLGELTDGMEQLLDGSSQLYEGLCTLLDKSGELVDGIDKLAAGAKELKKGTGELDSGVGRLQSGASQLRDGLSTLASKNGELNGGATQIFQALLSTARTQLEAAGLTVPELTISNYSEVLNGIILSLDETKVYSQALQQVTAAVEEQRPYITSQVTAAAKQQVTDGVTAKVEATVRPQVTAAVQEQVTAQVAATAREQVTAQVTAAVRENVENQVYPAITGVDKATWLASVSGGDAATLATVNAAVDAQMASSAVQSQIASAVDARMESAEVQAMIASGVETQMASSAVQTIVTENTNAKMNSPEVQAIIASNVDAQMNTDEIKAKIAENTELQVQKAISDNMAGETVQGKLAQASEGAKSVIALKTSLDSFNSFYLGLQAYTAGVSEAAAGAGTLKSGVDELKNGSGKLNAGMIELCDGILKLQNGAPALVEGVTKLRDGSMELSDGLKKFDEEGIQELIRVVEEDLDGVVERLKATVDVSRNYRSFAGISDEMDGQVKFIYRTDSVELP